MVECGDVQAAVALYTECDGLEWERSGCKMDLRYVPREHSFEGRQVGGGRGSWGKDCCCG